MNKKGFTLVELLAVIVILAVLMIVAATSGFGLFSDAKNKLNEEQAKALEEGLNLFLVEIDEENCLDYVGNEIYSDAELIFEQTSGTFTNCSKIRDYLFDYSTSRGDIDSDGKEDMYKSINIEKFIQSGYVSGSNMKDIKNTGDITLEIKWEKDTTGTKMDGTYIAGFSYEQYEGENNATTIVLYVDTINGDNSNNGKTAANAVASIDTAISKSGSKNPKIYLLSDATISSNITLTKDLAISSNGGTWTLDMNSKTITTTGTNITYSNLYIKNKPDSFLSEAKNKYNNVKITLNNYNYTSTYHIFTAPQTGSYELEVWGAQGGTRSAGTGGKGGYSKGTVRLDANDKLYVYVGNKPSTYSTTPNNGGGKGKRYSGSYPYTYAMPGGGATDIRTINGTWSTLNSLYSRIIVAGGGSGGAARSSEYRSGFAGGGSTSLGYSDLYKATMTSAGENGSFGKGADASSTVNKYMSGGGGGGWYGGGRVSGVHSTDVNYLGMTGGGSGYVYTSSTLLTEPEYPQPDSKYYLTNTQMIDGGSNLPKTDNPNETEEGHTGDGFAKITLILNS